MCCANVFLILIGLFIRFNCLFLWNKNASTGDFDSTRAHCIGIRMKNFLMTNAPMGSHGLQIPSRQWQTQWTKTSSEVMLLISYLLETFLTQGANLNHIWINRPIKHLQLYFLFRPYFFMSSNRAFSSQLKCMVWQLFWGFETWSSQITLNLMKPKTLCLY